MVFALCLDGLTIHPPCRGQSTKSLRLGSKCTRGLVGSRFRRQGNQWQAATSSVHVSLIVMNSLSTKSLSGSIHSCGLNLPDSLPRPETPLADGLARAETPLADAKLGVESPFHEVLQLAPQRSHDFIACKEDFARCIRSNETAVTRVLSLGLSAAHAKSGPGCGFRAQQK